MTKEKRKFDGYTFGLVLDRTFPIEHAEKSSSWGMTVRDLFSALPLSFPTRCSFEVD